MTKFIVGLILGFLLGSMVIGYTAMSGNRQDREYDKFAESSDNKVCILITLAE